MEPKNIKSDTLLLNGDTLSPMQPMIHPEIQVFLIPNLFVKPPMIGPIIALTPESIDPTKATDEWLALNDFINGSNSTPKEYPNPSENSIK